MVKETIYLYKALNWKPNKLKPSFAFRDDRENGLNNRGFISK